MSRQIIVRVPDTRIRVETQTEEVWVDNGSPEEGWYEERTIPYHYITGVETPAMCLVDIGDNWLELMFSANDWSETWQKNAAVLKQYPHRYC